MVADAAKRAANSFVMFDDEGISLITCSGISNTGKLTTKVGEEIMRRYPGLIASCLSARCDPEQLCYALAEAEKIMVLDGCTDGCASKKVKKQGYEPDIHVIATECGIIKAGMQDPRFDEIEILTSIIRKTLQ